MSANNPLIARFAGEPTLVAPEQGQRFEAYLAAVSGHEHFGAMMNATTVASSEDFWNPGERDAWAMRYRPYVIVDGVLQIPVKGVLLNNFPYQVGDWITGYEYIWEAFKRGCGDYATGTIKGIALVCDTPGGMVAGCFDARDRMIALKTETGCPVGGFAQESAYSAGYAMITVADAGQIYVSRTGGVGSIGVVTSHVDLSGMYEKMGVKVTFIASDPSKYEGNATEAPSKDFLERTQARIDELYAIFVSAVAQSRGLSEDAIRNDLKAYCFTATQATSNGLADKIGTLDDSLSAFAGALDEPSEHQGEEAMATEAELTVDQAVHDAAVATARTESAAAERDLIFAIIDSEEAQKRPAAARALAAEGGRTLEQATAFLAKLPEEKVEAVEPEKVETTTTFDAAMKSGNPDVGASGEKKKDGEDGGQDDILASLGSFGLIVEQK